MKFKDTEGDEYTFDPNAWNIINAEKRCGERFLTGIFEAAAATTDSEMADKLFGTTDRYCSVLYECSVPEDQQDKLPFDDFCKRFRLADLILMMPQVAEGVFSSLESPGGTIAPTGDNGGKPQKKEVGELETSGT